ncbi:MAG: ABC transporter ATP-binding protein, partial [Brevinematales bacterium]
KMGIREFSKKAAVISQYIEAVSIPVFDYVMMGRIPYRREFQLFDSAEDMKKTEHYIGQTGIDPIKNKRLDSISGGEAQMAQFARALNQEPVLLLMDEPTSHLDIKHQSGILDLTKKYNRETGLTIIMAIHDLNLAAEYCDELILMKNGTVRYSGIPSEILNYRTIEEIYETVVIVEKNPVSHKPHVFLVPGDLL